MVWSRVRQSTQVHLSQSFLASVIVNFSLPIHVKVLVEEDEEVDEEVEGLVEGVPLSSLL